MIDQWSEQLRCPQCRNDGMVSLSHSEDAETPTLIASQMASRPCKPSMARTSIAGPATCRSTSRLPQLAASFIRPASN
jgi:hypothetical protein